MKLLQAKMAQERLSDEEKKILMDCTKNNTIINAQIDQGSLTQEQYISFIKLQLSKDQKLLEVLVKLGKKENAAYVKKRIELMTAELSG